MYSLQGLIYNLFSQNTVVADVVYRLYDLRVLLMYF